MTVSDEKSSPKAQLVWLIQNALSRRSAIDFSVLTGTEAAELVVDLAEEVLQFFTEADSFRKDWVPPVETEGPLFSSIEAQAAFAEMDYNEVELDAAESARAGDFHPLAELLETRGFLRKSSSRRLAANKLRGHGNPRAKSRVNSDTWHEIAVISMGKEVRWAEAQRLWLDENPHVNSETLRSRLRHAEREEEWRPILRRNLTPRRSAKKNG